MDRLVTADAVRTLDGIVGDSLLLRGGQVAAMGHAEDLREPDLAEDRYPGGTIIPGLVDAHFHPTGYTASVTRLNVEDATDHADLVDRIRRYAESRDPNQPVVGTRLNEVTMAEGVLPDRTLLDSALADRPVLIYRYDGHVAIANTAGLALGQVSAGTPNPAGGSIDTDQDGRPTGVLKETAIDLVAGPLGGRAADLTPDELLTVLRDLRKMGLTRLGAIAALGQGLFCGGARELDLLCEVGPDLPLYLDVLVIADDPDELETAAARIGDTRARRLRFLGVKIFSDGSFGGRTAAMDEPFADRDTIGIDRLDPDRHGRLARAALAMGGTVAIHAIGDRANAGVLDLYEDLLDEGADPSKLRIEHVSVLRHADFERMGRLGVTGSVQPAFIGSEHAWVESILGGERLDRTYAFGSMLDAGIPLAGGSDCPVEPPSPLAGFEAARHRFGLTPDESLSGPDALALFSSWASRSLGAEEPLSTNGPAHFTVLDGDPVTEPAERVGNMPVLATWVDGEPG